MIANVDAEPKQTAAASIEALIQQIASPVRWEAVMRRMVADGATAFVEVGPGSVLMGLGKKIARDASFAHLDSPAIFPPSNPSLPAPTPARGRSVPMGSFDGKIVIVTGASRGIGRAIAVELARRGATIVAAAAARTRSRWSTRSLPPAAEPRPPRPR